MSEETDFHEMAKALAKGLSNGYADNDLVGESIGLCDSDTDETLLIKKRAVIAGKDGPVSLLYTTAERGRICQVRSGNMHIHYFFDEPGSQKHIAEDEPRNRVTLAQISENAPAL